MSKTSSLVLLSVATLLFSGCAMDSVSYNNAVVDHVTEISTAWDNAYNAYLEGVPQDVYADSTIDLARMQTAYDELSPLIDQIETDLLTLESADSEQQVSVEGALIYFQMSAQDYLVVYQEILDYYAGDFGSDLDKVAELDTKLYDADDIWVDAHNALGDVLDSTAY